MNGFGNALSFKSITDDDIQYCENEIKKNGESIENQLNDSAHMNCEINKQYLVQTFGSFSENPSQFHFLRGEISLIKQLVDHVKNIVDENGPNTGLERFKYKNKQARKARCKQRLQSNEESKQSNPNNLIQQTTEPDAANAQEDYISTQNSGTKILSSSLFSRVKICLDSYQLADLDVEQLDESIVTVQYENNKIVGKIVCIICPKKTPKKVFYDQKSGHWVITNFQKHLQNSHKLVPAIPARKQQKFDNEIDSIGTKNNESKDNETDPNLINSEHLEHKIINEFESDSLKSDAIEDEDNDNWLYHQLTAQINVIMEAVLSNGEEEDAMIFKLNGEMVNLTVVNILGNGNCLFAAIVHQLWQYPVNSTQHKNATEQLRSKVVDYILANFESFQFNLRDRVYESKSANEISDMAAECKSYVRNVLSRNGHYGGFETIKAVAEMYKVNVLTFIEGEECSFYSTTKIPNKTITLAWRNGLACDGQQIKNHYDSVYDVKPDYLLKISESVVYKQSN